MIILSEEIKIVKSLGESGLSGLKRVSKTIENEAKEQKDERGVIKAGEQTIRPCQDFQYHLIL